MNRPAMAKPELCDLVHYVSYGTPGGEYSSVCRAAIVTEVGAWATVTEQHIAAHNATEGHRARDLRQWWVEDAVSLTVLNPTGQFLNPCRHDEGDRAGGTWHWPHETP